MAETPAVTNPTDYSSLYTLTTGVHDSQGRRDTMEDTHVTFDDVKAVPEFVNLTTFSKIAYLGVFYGHGGKKNSRKH
jgi:serine/threonine protein phosphatase PrpC